MPWGFAAAGIAGAVATSALAPSAPATPDYAGAAAQQGQNNLDVANLNNKANRPNVYNPYGSQTWSQDANGNWTTHQNLNATQQQLLDAQNKDSLALAQTGNNSLDRVSQAESKSFDTSQYPSLQYGAKVGPIQSTFGTDAASLQKQASDAAASRGNQDIANQTEQTKAQLIAQGITPGSDAYNRAMQPLERATVDNDNRSFLTGTTYANQLFGQQQQQASFANNAENQSFNQTQSSNAQTDQARQQAIQEQAYLRSLPLNELNALRSGSQVTSPTFVTPNPQGTAAAPAPLFGAAQAQGAANQQTYQNQLGAYNNMTSGLFGLGGTAANAYFGG